MQKKVRKLLKPVPVKNFVRASTVEGCVSGHLTQDCDGLKAILTGSADLRERLLTTAKGTPGAVLYFANVVNLPFVSESIVRPLQRHEGRSGMEYIAQQVVNVPEYSLESDLYKVACALSEGSVAVLMTGESCVLLVPLFAMEHRPIERAVQEDVLIGSHESFCESLGSNIALLRRRIATPDFKVKELTIGRRSRTTVAILYLEHVAPAKLIAEMEERLKRIDIDFVLGITYLTDFIEDDPRSIFPTLRATEIPVRVMAALMEGRVAVMAEGDSAALIAPTFAPEFLQASEDYFDRPVSATFFRLIRLVGLLLAIFLPGIWIALVTFHHGIMPTTLFDSIAAGREGVPLPTVLEISVLILGFDLIVESSTRMPTRIGQALGIVGGIILGQAAVQAALVSPAMVIVAALTGLAIFTQPSINFLSPLRFLKYPVLVAASILGIFGVVWALICILIAVTSLRSFGYPYMYPLAPFNLQGAVDVFVRVPKFWHEKRPSLLSSPEEARMDTPQPRPIARKKQ